MRCGRGKRRCLYFSQEIIGNEGADGPAENLDRIFVNGFKNGCGQGVPADQRQHCLWQIVERIAVTGSEELVGRDNFNALSHIPGEEWTTTKLQGRGSFPIRRIGPNQENRAAGYPFRALVYIRNSAKLRPVCCGTGRPAFSILNNWHQDIRTGQAVAREGAHGGSCGNYLFRGFTVFRLASRFNKVKTDITKIIEAPGEILSPFV